MCIRVYVHAPISVTVTDCMPTSSCGLYTAELKQASPVFSILFFVVYNVITVFVLLNVFIGIIGEAYVEV